MIKSWKHKGLKDLFESGHSSKVRHDLKDRALERLDVLEQATRPQDMNLPGFGFHGLQGKPKRYAVSVNGPWRITFGWDRGAVKVDLEQYH